MVREGYWYGLPLVLAAGGLIGLKLYWFGAFFLIIALLVLNFFRDPERSITTEPGAMVSPADGRVVQIANDEYAGRPVRRVSIFMSPLDVHVNRSPVPGTIREIAYQRGSFHVASQARASIENEQNIFTIEGSDGTVVVKQVAGLLARRIVFWKRRGDQVARGERVGLIKFGSRVDVLVDPGVEIRVKVGDHIRAGSDIIGFVRPKT